MPSQVRAFVFGSLMASLMLAAATRTTHAQSLDALVAQSVARIARQAGQPARRFDLTLDAAVQRALERNLDIAVQRIHPLVQDMQIVAANAAFLPFASSGLILDQATAPNRFVFDGGGLAGQSIVTDMGVYDVAIGQQMKWGGGGYDVAWDSLANTPSGARRIRCRRRTAASMAIRAPNFSSSPGDAAGVGGARTGQSRSGGWSKGGA